MRSGVASSPRPTCSGSPPGQGLPFLAYNGRCERVVGNEHITQARLAIVQLAYEAEITLKMLEQLPEDEATQLDVENLTRLLEHRGGQVDTAARTLQARLSGAMNLALLKAETSGGAAR